MALHIEHIIWDWNGTIFGDGRALIESTIEAFSAAGLGKITRQQYQHHHTQPISAFYEKLAGRALTGAEQDLLSEHFQMAYVSRRDHIGLAPGARQALELWHRTGRRQSLLSMHPHERLLPLVRKTDIHHLFTLVEGWSSGDFGRKAPHLRRHLDRLSLDPAEVLLIGDSVDDARAARSCGVNCLLYRAEEGALHARDHFCEFGFPIISSLPEAISELIEESS